MCGMPCGEEMILLSGSIVEHIGSMPCYKAGNLSVVCLAVKK